MLINNIILKNKSMPTKENFISVNSQNILIQVIAATMDTNYLQDVLDELVKLAPLAKIIGSSSDEAICNDEILSNEQIVISILSFDSTTILTSFIKTQTNNTATSLADNVMEKNTKLLISFSDASSINGELFLDEIYEKYPNIPISGGVAATPTFSDTFVIESNNIIENGAVMASLNSDTLDVYIDNSFGWDAIGKMFTITKADANCVMQIDTFTPLELFKKYLGKKIVEALPGVGSSFPLIIKRKSDLIARGILALDGENFIVSGNVKVGDSVYIGYGDPKKVLHQNKMNHNLIQKNPEVILNYYCVGRRTFLPHDFVEYEVKVLNSIAPTVGMFTLGEFYTGNEHNLLNFSSTVVALKEKNTDKKVTKPKAIEIPHRKNLGLVSDGLFNFINVRSKELSELAFYDELTGLPNKNYFTDTLEYNLHTANINGLQGAIFFIDLDDFKKINETAGHYIGDKILKHIAKTLDAKLDDSSMIFRFGGDEFVVISKDADQASSLAFNIMKIINSEMEIESRKYYLNSSVGITFYSAENSDIHELIKQADIAMYYSKNSGKNKYTIYDNSMGTKAKNDYKIERELREAIKNKEFVLHYQPQYNMKTNEIVSAEALLRWNHPTHGLLFPDSFIEISENSNLIIPIGELVLDMALEFKSTTQKLKKIAVNISPKQFNDKLLDTVFQKLKKYSVEASSLEMEITESLSMNEDADIMNILISLNKLGVLLSIDDFGTGYSSLSYLKRMPINILKIDRSFIMDIPNDKNDVTITKTIIAMAKALEFDIVAEGIETQEQVDFLLKEDNIIAQGYFYSKPVPEDEFLKLLE